MHPRFGNIPLLLF
jgi:hypothetical protein